MLHYDFRKGTKLFIICKDGRKYVDKYKETKSSRLVCEHRTFDFQELRSVTIYRNQPID